MKSNIKSKLFGSILSDGSFKFLPLSAYNSQHDLKIKNIDVFSHPAWTGRRPKEQTEISIFINRFNNNKLN